jgi:hypothetical protein
MTCQQLSKYQLLKKEAGKIEGDVRNLTMIFQDLSNGISSIRNTLDSHRMSKRTYSDDSPIQKRFQQEALVRQFENDKSM